MFIFKNPDSHSPLNRAITSLSLLSLLTLSCVQGIAAETSTDSHSLSKIPALMQEFVDKEETTGVVVLASHKGKIISHSAVGYQSLEPEIPMRKSSIFRAASISKPFVAVAVMMLVEEGKVSLDDPIEKHIPEFKGLQMTVADYDIEAREIKLVEPSRPVTIQDCLNHTHALPLTARVDAATNIRDHVLASAQSTLDWEPGSKWRYGGEGLHVAAHIVELHSGMSYADFLQKRIFNSLGMKDTYFMRDEVPKKRLVEIYTRDKNKQEWSTNNSSVRYRPYFRPDGGLYMTAENLFRFYQMMLNEGTWKGKRIIEKETANTLVTITCGHLDKGDHIKGCYSALGFRTVREPVDPKTAALTPGSYGHGGSGGSIVWADPANNTIYIYMRNNYGTNQTAMIELFQRVVSEAVE